MSAKFDYSGVAVLVTGGSNGIGLAIAQAFGRSGADVTITGTQPDKSSYADDLSGFSYRQVKMDETSSIEVLIAAVERVDVLVNNAGTAIRAPESLTPEGFEKNIAINLNAVFRLSQGFHKKLAHKPGCIINVASMFSFFGSARVPGYGASKAGVVQLTKTLAALYAADGIRVNAIAPGWVETKLTEGVRGTQALSRPIMERTPLGRWSRPEEMAGTALYLACDELAGFVTGATIPIDGGFSAS